MSFLTGICRDFAEISRKVEQGGISKLDDNSRALLDAMFETLQRSLDLPDTRTQQLGHLHHPGVREWVQEYIDEHRNELTADTLKRVEQCRDGGVM